MSAIFEISLPLALLLSIAAGDPVSATADPDARPDISAYAVSERRWLEMMSRHGAEVGQGALSGRIFRTRSGIVYVPVERERQAIWALRKVSDVAGPIVQRAAEANARWIAETLGRPASARELYLVHVASRGEGLALITAVGAQAKRPAAELAPEAARSLPALFFAGARPRTVAEVSLLVEIELAGAARRLAARKHEACKGDGWCAVVSHDRTGARPLAAARP